MQPEPSLGQSRPSMSVTKLITVGVKNAESKTRHVVRKHDLKKKPLSSAGDQKATARHGMASSGAVGTWQRVIHNTEQYQRCQLFYRGLLARWGMAKRALREHCSMDNRNAVSWCRGPDKHTNFSSSWQQKFLHQFFHAHKMPAGFTLRELSADAARWESSL